MKFKSIYLVVAVLLLSAPANAAQTLSFGIVPQHSTSKLTRQWNPILRYLSDKTGYRLIFKSATNITRFEEQLLEGHYDIAYMNPYHYVLAHDRTGYTAFAKQKDNVIQGVLVVSKDSPVQSLEQLSHQTLAFPSESAFAASILTRARLTRGGIPFQATYLGSHDKVYRAVANGMYVAGGGIVRTLDTTSPSVRQQLRILWYSKPYPPHAFAAHPRLNADTVQRLLLAMQAMSRDPAGRRLLADLEFSGIEPARDQEWDEIREMDSRLLQMPD